MLYIVKTPPLRNSALKEALDMLMTTAAFGQTTVLWLHQRPLQAIAAGLADTALLESLPAFGVRCVALAEDLSAVDHLPLDVEPLSGAAAKDLHHQSDYTLVF